jgi:hypothetical protein
MSFGVPRIGVVSSQSCGKGINSGLVGREASSPALPAEMHTSRMKPETRGNTVYRKLLLLIENAGVLF